MRRALVVGVLLFAGIAVMPTGAQQNPDEFRWTGQIGRGKSVEIKGVNGGIRASLASGNQVEVLAHKRARRSNTADVFIEVVEHDGNVTICAVYPPSAHSSGSSGSTGTGYSSRNFRRTPRTDSNAGPNECKPGSEGRMNTPSLYGGNWRWRMKPGALTSQLAEKLAHLADVSDRLPQPIPDPPDADFAA